MVGRRLAHYEIHSHLGSGGMGDVYRAIDTRLGRSVAIKFLRDDLATNPGRAARLAREARALASLNHPHIATIHGQEEADGRMFLVMEFVDGRTLQERIGGRPILVAEAVPIALQMIEAIETAHESGIIHRDLKPANVKITSDGRVKVLDFGLAKLVADEVSQMEVTSAVTPPLTNTGVILGTPAYMAPEQAKGLEIDRRADIFAFGCVLFEMISGQRAFPGGNAADVMAGVLEREPDWSALPPGVPPSLERLLRLCLEKDPRRRRQSAGDVRIDLERALTEVAPVTARTEQPRVPYVAWTAAAVLLLTAAAAGAWLARRPPAAPPMRLQIVTPQTLDPMHFAISPDGTHVVFGASSGSDSRERLHIRDLNSTTAQVLPGTEGARYPFWSADNRSVGFFASGKLFRVDLAGGAPQALAPAVNPVGPGAWGVDGTILFSPTTVSPLLRVTASGDPATAATELRAPKQTNHRAPSFLPDGRRFLFFATGDPEESGVYLASLDGGSPKRLTKADSAAIYVAPDHILFVQQGKLVARRIDDDAGELSGDPVTVASSVSVSNMVGWFSASATGIIVYRSGNQAPRRTIWFDRSGAAVGSAEDANAPALSLDQRYAAFDRTINGNRDVWIRDLVRGGVRPLTRHPAVDGHPVWSPDGSQVAFESLRNGTFDVWTKQAGGDAPETVVLATPDNEWPLDWSTDGRFLLVHRSDGNYTASDLLALPMTGSDRTPIVVANSPYEERTGSFSPDGRLVVYETDESGRPEIVMKAFQRPGGVTRVSTDGGVTPRWSIDGETIYFVAPDGGLMSVSASKTGSSVTLGKPRRMFGTHIVPQVFTFQYAVSSDERFLINSLEVERVTASPLTLILNWKP